MEWTDILWAFLFQLLLTVGIILAAGLLLMAGKRFFLRACGRKAYWIERITGVIGTPIHELSHALFCILFGHRIDEIRLFTPGAQDGTLGYVSHSYRKRNLYHRIGNFFIAIAPILGGSFVILLLMWLLLPETARFVVGSCVTAGGAISKAEGLSALGIFFELLKGLLPALFSGAHFSEPKWWFFLLLSVFILLHMQLSHADIRSGLGGLGFLAGLLLAVDLVLAFLYPEGVYAVTAGAAAAGAFLATFLSIGLLLMLVIVAISFIILLFSRH